MAKEYYLVCYCNPYHARKYYNGQKVLKRDCATPVKWVIDDDYGNGLSFDEAMERLKDIMFRHYPCAEYYDKDSYGTMLSELKAEDEDFTEADIKAAWERFQGTGYYYEGILILADGDTSFEDDVLDFRIEEIE